MLTICYIKFLWNATPIQTDKSKLLFLAKNALRDTITPPRIANMLHATPRLPNFGEVIRYKGEF
jgi:hypothetical protein